MKSKTLNDLREEGKITELFERLGFKDPLGHDLLACVDFQELVRDAETLRKARAALVDHAEEIAYARWSIGSFPGTLSEDANIALISLAYALGDIERNSPEKFAQECDEEHEEYLRERWQDHYSNIAQGLNATQEAGDE